VIGGMRVGGMGHCITRGAFGVQFWPTTLQLAACISARVRSSARISGSLGRPGCVSVPGLGYQQCILQPLNQLREKPGYAMRCPPLEGFAARGQISPASNCASCSARCRAKLFAALRSAKQQVLDQYLACHVRTTTAFLLCPFPGPWRLRASSACTQLLADLHRSWLSVL